MARELIQIGIDAQSATSGVQRAVSAESIAIEYTRNTWETETRRLAEREIEQVVSEYQKVKYVNLKIDAGSVLNANVTHALVDSPWGDQVPWVLEASANSYESFLVKHLQSVDGFTPKITVCSVIHDNLAVQANAVDTALGHWRMPKIIDIPCFNHLVNLVFVHSREDCRALNALVNRVLQWQELLRAIGVSAPSVPKTRWLYIVEVTRFIMSVEELPAALTATAVQSLEEQRPGNS